jgi:hypothetical protein
VSFYEVNGDIVDLLRLHGNIWCINGCHIVGDLAADEIERLRAVLDAIDNLPRTPPGLREDANTIQHINGYAVAMHRVNALLHPEGGES